MNSQVPSKSDGTEDQRFSPPAVSLPKGGGALKGIGEKFAANPVTGTGSLTIPLSLSPGRSGFTPALTLSYDSGAGNGPFGFGWSIGYPTITRRTDRGLPQYLDDQESDVYILSGAEDLVPVTNPDGTWFEEQRDGYRIRRYRPRIEGLFARIERWTNLNDATDVFWRSISRENVTTYYGRSAESRIADPDDPTRIFSWLICQSYDDKGNSTVFEYQEEDSSGIDLSHAQEKNRTAGGRTANRYLKRVKYGNRTPNRDFNGSVIDPTQLDDWMFELVFDYDEGHYEVLPNDAQERQFVRAETNITLDWSLRQDPFSNYRAGFEVRTYRLCRRALMFHHFPEELGAPDYLVRSTEFTYNPSPIASFIIQVTQSGYVRQPDGTYLKKSLPPLSFEYSKAEINDEIETIDAESLRNLPVGANGLEYQWLDLDGEGLQCVLAEQEGGWYYKRNVSPISTVKENGKEKVVARLDPLIEVMTEPSTCKAGSARHQFLDLAGDGSLDVVQFEKPVAGFFERTEDERWESFIPFESAPNVRWDDPNLRFADLTGDGHADILISEDDTLTWYPSLAEEGFGPAERVHQSWDEEEGPRLIFADGTQSNYLADLSGDGLADLVRIRNGEVCYWPNLGYGHFGAKVTMDNAPWFDAPDQFDQGRIRLADIDGSGTTDIIYLERHRVAIYRNECGNGWSPAEYLESFPDVDELSSVTAVDLLGNGTACLVWSSPLPGNAQRKMRYIALMEDKPHLLVGVKNNLGAETVVQYAPSTKFYLQDKLDGEPWITRLPFPVHVVERVETHDLISRNRFVTRYAYHHGYFDGEEREFRGFGMVEQWDTEELGSLKESGTLPDASNIDESSYVPPAYTKTWFHTGAYIEGERISRHFEDEYYREGDESEGLTGLTDEQLEVMLLPDTKFPTTLKQQNGSSIPWELTAEEIREACRALKGAVLRREIYALDGTDDQDRPYSAIEQNYTIELLQPQGNDKHAVFFTHPRESIDFHYERRLFKVVGNTVVDPATAPPTAQNLVDPRVTHTMTLEVDGYGNVLKSVAIGYGRRYDDSSQLLTPQDWEKQKRIQATYTDNRFTNPVEESDAYRTPLLCEACTYELLKVTPDAYQAQVTNLFRFDEMLAKASQASDGNHDLPYEDIYATGATANHPYRRLIEHVRTLYRPDDLGAAQSDPLELLPLGTVEPLALPGESYKLAFTPGLLTKVFQRNGQALLPNPADVLGGQGADKGGYVDLDGDGHWWVPSGRVLYSPNKNDTAAHELTYARQHFFVPHRYRDPFNQSATVDYDNPHVLLVIKTEDALQNRLEAAHDYRTLQPRLITDLNGNRSEAAFDGLGMVVATAVKGKEGENLGDLLEDFDADPPLADLEAFIADPYAEAAALLGKATTRIIYDLERFQRAGQPPFAATLARETHLADPGGSQSKIQISFSYSDGFGREIQKKIQAEPGPVVEGGPVVNPRWVGSGWAIFNNKGKPVRQYEPFFGATHDFEFARTSGVSPILFYDPVERIVATLHPNHTWGKVVFDPWQQTTYDVNDTVTSDPRTDYNVKEFFIRLPDADYLPTWFALRTDPAHAAEAALTWPNPQIREAERRAAQKAAKHADTPAAVYFDSLRRPFLTIAHNKFDRRKPDDTIETIEEKYSTRVELDIEGNQREVIDAKDRIVMRYGYDMLGNRIHQASIEAGERWTLGDVTSKPIRGWDSRGHTFRTEYDELRRLARSFVTGDDPQNANQEHCFQVNVYGEKAVHAQPTLNLRGKLLLHCDGAGVVVNVDQNPQTDRDEAYDFKGNPLRTTRWLAREYKRTVDWNGVDWGAVEAALSANQFQLANILQPLSAMLETETFASSTKYDALNRAVSITAPDNSVYRPTFNEANHLEKVDVNLRGEQLPTSFVADIDYNAKGQRTLIDYGNGARTEYEYDPLTFRLTNLKTTRPANLNGMGTQLFEDPSTVQDLHYTYDPAGNITRIADEALQVIFHNNQQVEPNCHYTYDGLYRLIEATGHEHIAQSGFQFNPPDRNYRDYPLVGAAHLNDVQAIRNYKELYEYDPVGNFERMIHQASDGNWTRVYEYNEPSLLELGKNSNRLSRTIVGGNSPEPYAYDAHGNITAMPHLPQMRWDFKDQLSATSQQVVNNGNPETTYYVYDAAGQRVLKVTESGNGTRLKERIYIGGVEVYREFAGNSMTLRLERETLHIMDDKQRIAMVETKTIDSQSPTVNFQPLIRYQLGNHLGSSSLELGGQGQIISYEEYYPYGTASYQAYLGAAEVSLKRYRYTGKERDEETGLNYHGARYYAPWLGRWTSCDPLGLTESPNLCTYVLNRPSTRVDLTGGQSDDPDGGDKPKTTDPVTNKRPVKFFRTESEISVAKWKEYFQSQPDVDKVITGSRLKDPVTKKGIGSGKGTGPQDLVVVWKKTGKATVIELSTDNEFARGEAYSTSRKAYQAKYVQKTLAREGGAVVGNEQIGYYDVIASWKATGSPEPNQTYVIPGRPVDAPAAAPSTGPMTAPAETPEAALGPTASVPEGTLFFPGGGGEPTITLDPAPSAGQVGIGILATIGPPLVEEGARKLGASENEAKTAGFLTAVGTCAAWGASIGAPEGGIGAIPGAIIGAVVGAVSYGSDTIFAPIDIEGLKEQYNARHPR
jgi:RHS repeat-associated protein